MVKHVQTRTRIRVKSHHCHNVTIYDSNLCGMHSRTYTCKPCKDCCECNAGSESSGSQGSSSSSDSDSLSADPQLSAHRSALQKPYEAVTHLQTSRDIPSLTRRFGAMCHCLIPVVSHERHGFYSEARLTKLIVDCSSREKLFWACA